jgi:DNA processing protein
MEASDQGIPTFQALTPEQLLGPLNDVEAKGAPKTLYCAGHVELVRERGCVAIVGTREPSDDAKNRASRLARFLAQRDIVVVSGLAAGIDTDAHESCIAAGGRTVAVLGTPLDDVYPRANSALQAQIARNHLAISQFAPGSRTQPKNFVLRNRTMALIASASVIVEAKDHGGSLSQGWEALRMGRPLFLMRSLLSRKDLHWPHEMIAYGAIELREPEQLLEVVSAPQSWTGGDAPF